MKTDPVAYVGLGANLQRPVEQLSAAIAQLGRQAGVTVLARSSFYVSAPVGEAYQGQPDYVNAAVRLATTLDARALLERLLDIERAFGRDRSVPYAARTLDLDLLLYGAARIDEPGLQVPHPRMHERAFVLEPLFEIEPGLDIPGRGPVAALRAACRGQPLRLLETA